MTTYTITSDQLASVQASRLQHLDRGDEAAAKALEVDEAALFKAEMQRLEVPPGSLLDEPAGRSLWQASSVREKSLMLKAFKAGRALPKASAPELVALTDERIMQYMAPWHTHDDPDDRGDLIACVRAMLHGANESLGRDEARMALWEAMNEAEKVGNRHDDKLIQAALFNAGFRIFRSAAIAASQPAPHPVALTDGVCDVAAIKAREKIAAEKGIDFDDVKTDTDLHWTWRRALVRAGAEAAHALAASPSAKVVAQAAPEGWKIVPIEPTVSMLREAAMAYELVRISLGGHVLAERRAYEAALAAAPTPSKGEA